jgi:hypothetical protein
MARMRLDREPEPPVRWAAETDHRSLVAQTHLIIHVPEGGTRIGRARVGDRSAREITIVLQPIALGQRLRDLLIQERPTDFVQHLGDGLRFGLTEPLERAGHATVVGPARLLPGVGHRSVLVQRATVAAEVFQMRQPGQDRHQKFQHFGLRTESAGLLVHRHSHQGFDQAQMLGILTQQDEQRMLGMAG